MELTPARVVVVVVDEDDIVVANVAGVPNFDVMNIAAGSVDSLLTASPTSGAVVLYDPTIHDDGMQRLRQLVVRVAAPVIAFAQNVEVDSVIKAVAAGARGYIAKTCSGLELRGHVENVAQGGVSIDGAIVGDLVQLVCDARQLEPWPARNWGLSRRESDVLCLLAEGFANRQIADKLVLGQETVKSHLHAIYRKLHVTNRRAAIVFAREHHLTS